MSALLQQLHSILGGSSPVTGYIGSAIVALDVAQLVLVQNGIPQDIGGWFYFGLAFVTGLGVRFSKQENKTHAPVPLVEPQKVSAAPTTLAKPPGA